jgi:hypothetical protein
MKRKFILFLLFLLKQREKIIHKKLFYLIGRGIKILFDAKVSPSHFATFTAFSGSSSRTDLNGSKLALLCSVTVFAQAILSLCTSKLG